MHINLEKLKKELPYNTSSVLDSMTGYHIMLDDIIKDYIYEEMDVENIFLNTLVEYEFITTYRKKKVLDLKKIENECHLQTFQVVLEELLYRLIFISTDITSEDLNEEEMISMFEEETEEDFVKNTENLSVEADNLKLLKTSLYAKSLEKYGFLKVKKDGSILTDKFKDYIKDEENKELYKSFLDYCFTVIKTEGLEYNPVITQFLKEENIIEE